MLYNQSFLGLQCYEHGFAYKSVKWISRIKTADYMRKLNVTFLI